MHRRATVALVLGIFLSTLWLSWVISREQTWTREINLLSRRLALVDLDRQRLAASLVEQQQVNTKFVEREKRREIEGMVAWLRGLPFLHPVTYRQISRAELPAILRQKLTQQMSNGELRGAEISLVAFGLLPEGVDLEKTYLDLLGEQIGAFYDQHSAELFMFNERPLSNGQNRIILAHELTHALEDQHFQLARLPLDTKGNDDRALAASALVEGDATMVMSQYMLHDLSGAAMRDALVGALATDSTQLARAPKYLREMLLFPYLKGQEFCRALYRDGGRAALDKAFAEPPTSTAEILHPDRYTNLNQARRPSEVLFDNVGRSPLVPLRDNVLGEFGVRQWLMRWTGNEDTAAGIASAWCGDRYLVYGDAKHYSVVWKTVWSSPQAAHHFAEAALACWQVRYGEGATRQFIQDPKNGKTEQDSAQFGPTRQNGRWLMLSEDGTDVIFIDAQDATWRNSLAEQSAVSSDTKPIFYGHIFR